MHRHELLLYPEGGSSFTWIAQWESRLLLQRVCLAQTSQKAFSKLAGLPCHLDESRNVWRIFVVTVTARNSDRIFFWVSGFWSICCQVSLRSSFMDVRNVKAVILKGCVMLINRCFQHNALSVCLTSKTECPETYLFDALVYGVMSAKSSLFSSSLLDYRNTPLFQDPQV